MARTSTNSNKNIETEGNEEVVTSVVETKAAKYDDENINLDIKVTVKNLAPWTVGFARMQDGIGSVMIAENGVTRISRNEIVAQVNRGNKLFVGTDGNGSHATIYIDDEATRRWVGFDTDESKQMIFSNDMVKSLFAKKNGDFEKELKKCIVTRAEKIALMSAIKELGINDYNKIVISCNHTGYKL